MPNPKITVTLTVDQSIVDALNAHTDALNRFTLAKQYEDETPKAQTDSDVAQIGVNNPTPMVPVSQDLSGVNPPVPQTPAVPVAPIPQNVPVQATSAPQQTLTAAVSYPQPGGLPVYATPQPSTSIETLMRAGVELMNRGVNAATVLNEFGVQALTELPTDKYDQLAARLRQLGADI